MRAKLVLVVTCFALLAATTASAQVVKGQFLVGPTVSIGVPMGDFGDFASTGLGVGATGDFMVSDNVAIGGDVVYNFFGVKDEFSEPGVDVSFKILQFGAHGKVFLSPEETTNPFFFGGVGLYNGKQTVEYMGVSISSSSTDFGINGGGGVMFTVSEQAKVAVNAVLHNVFTEGSSTTYFGGAATLFFGFGAQ